MPEGLKIDSIKCELYEMPDMGDEDTKKEKDTTILAIYYFGDEPEVATNYYLARAYRNSQSLQSNSKEFLTYESHEDKNYTHLVTFGENVIGNDLITFKLYTIDRSYYRYLEAIRNMDQTGMATSLSGPPANAVGNVPNALGYFVVALYQQQLLKRRTLDNEINLKISQSCKLQKAFLFILESLLLQVF
ncbi:MAG: DUF4249 family protein [Bacteroidales bacterium]|nr:DUF4249 family protein [Bacteroidales bacterium]